MIDVIFLSFVSRRLNEIVHFKNGFKKYCQISNSILNKDKLYDFFMERYNDLIDKLTFNFSLTDCLYFKYRLVTLKNESCLTNVICHLLFCNRSPAKSNCWRLCLRWYVKNGDDFVSSVEYHFSLIFVNKFNNKDFELVFTQERRMSFKLDLLYSSKTHFGLVDSAQNRCMNFLIVKKPSDFVVVLSGVYVRILFNILYEISIDIRKTPGEYKGRDSAEWRELFLDYCVSFVRTFYFENVCLLLHSVSFLRMYKDFEINCGYSDENIVLKKFEQYKMHMKTFIHILKRILSKKYSDVEFEKNWNGKKGQ